MDSVNFLNVEYIYLRVFDLLKNFDVISVLNFIIHVFNILRPFTIIIGLGALVVIVYSKLRLHHLDKAQEHKYFSSASRKIAPEPARDTGLSDTWSKIQAHIHSDNPAEWRLAILEADIMLGDVLEKMGYQGDSIGDKLKGIKKEDFLTLDQAWEAHKVRNQIAHEGVDFLLNERDAKRVIGLYKSVFDEFYHI